MRQGAFEAERLWRDQQALRERVRALRSFTVPEGDAAVTDGVRAWAHGQALNGRSVIGHRP